MKQRLNKIIAQSGRSSRRGADDLIRDGRVAINNAIVYELGQIADPEHDNITVDGQPLNQETLVYIKLHKPRGFVTTTRSFRNEKNVLSLLPSRSERLFPVGRLDKDTSGLLILTNDGPLAHELTHPSFVIDRVYEVIIDGRLSNETKQLIERGGLAVDDYLTSPCQIKILKQTDNSTALTITLHEGKKREIRKIFGTLGHPVITLKRVQYGKLKLGALPVGDWEQIDRDQII